MPANGPPTAPRTTEDLVEEALAVHAERPGALLPIFHHLQDALGYVPPDAVPRIAKALNLSRADVHGVLGFYHDFRTSPPGRHVLKLCRAEACQAVGCDAVIDEVRRRLGVSFGETRADGSVTLEAVYCLGNCSLGPSALLDGRLHGRMTADRVDALLAARSAPAGTSTPARTSAPGAAS